MLLGDQRRQSEVDFLVSFGVRRRRLVREEIRMFSPRPIRSLRDTGQTFGHPADFRCEDYLDAGFRKMRGDPQQVRLRFAPFAARFVRERTWHKSQKIETHADDSLTLTFTASCLDKLKRWVLSWGADCEELACPRPQNGCRMKTLKHSWYLGTGYGIGSFRRCRRL